MEVLRLLLIVALTLSVPALGQASASGATQCLMEASESAAMHTGAECRTANLDKHVQHAKDSCHHGQACMASPALQGVDTHYLFHALPPIRTVATLPDSALILTPPDTFWRPPRLS